MPELATSRSSPNEYKPQGNELEATPQLTTTLCYSLSRTPRRTWNRGFSRSSSQNSGNADDIMTNENHSSNKKTKRIGEHARYIKKALLKQHNSLDSTDSLSKIS